MNIIQQFSIWFLPVLLGITVHEVAHGWIAYRLGDATAFTAGRLTLNPFKHIDPIGTILVPLVLFWLGSSFLFGWAKPVPVTYNNLCRPRRDMALVAAAGPIANLLMAFLWGVVLKIGQLLGAGFVWLAIPLIFMGYAGISFNIILMVMNLLPIPPLDGGRILVGLLPAPFAGWLERGEPYGIIIMLLLLSTGNLGRLMAPFVNFIQHAMLSVFALQ